MNTSTYYGLNLAEGSDIVNPLIIDVPNYEKIDEVMHDNATASVGLATELLTGTVHALVRSNDETAVFRFIATANFTAGDTFTVDGVQVTALLPTGEPLGTGAYVINANVLCILTGTLLTVYVPSGAVSIAEDSNKLGGELPSYYGTASDVNQANLVAQAAATLANQVNTGLTVLENGKVIYNSNTDSLDVYVNGSVVGSLYCGFQALNPLVPLMTSNTAPSGVAFASSEYNGRLAYLAFDRNESTEWISNSGTVQSIGYDFGVTKNVKQVALSFVYGSSVGAFEASVQYSDDNVNWIDTGASVSGLDYPTTSATINVSTITAHRYWRVQLSASTVHNYNIHSLQFYGR